MEGMEESNRQQTIRLSEQVLLFNLYVHVYFFILILIRVFIFLFFFCIYLLFADISEKKYIFFYKAGGRERDSVGGAAALSRGPQEGKCCS